MTLRYVVSVLLESGDVESLEEYATYEDAVAYVEHQMALEDIVLWSDDGTVYYQICVGDTL